MKIVSLKSKHSLLQIETNLNQFGMKRLRYDCLKLVQLCQIQELRSSKQQFCLGEAIYRPYFLEKGGFCLVLTLLNAPI